jgi:hypothetical protein
MTQLVCRRKPAILNFGDYRVAGIEHNADMERLCITQTRTRKAAGDKIAIDEPQRALVSVKAEDRETLCHGAFRLVPGIRTPEI